MGKEKLLAHPIVGYLLWLKTYADIGIDGFLSIRDLKYFVRGYEKALSDTNLDNPLWYFWIWTEHELEKEKFSSEIYFSYIERVQTSDIDGLKKFYTLFDRFLETYNSEDIIYAYQE